jgi:uncharacterized protein YqfB (UPF0267 family)
MNKQTEQIKLLNLKLFIRDIYAFNYGVKTDLTFFKDIRITAKRVFISTTELNVDYSIGEFLMVFNTIKNPIYDSIKSDMSHIFLKLLSDSGKQYNIQLSELSK